jgi:uncharacterized protein (TIGR04551 family)
VVGQVDNVTDVPGWGGVKGSVTLLSGGFVFRGDLRLLHDALKLGLEIGYASGDDSEDPNGVVNYQQANLTPPLANRISRFAFDPDYHVDLILFRRILGTVNNATYFKPWISYDIVDSFTARLDAMYAIANRFVAYPGNSYNLGLELDASLLYRNEEEGFYAGVTFGYLFPFDALKHPGSIFPGFDKGPDGAFTLQARLAVKF